MNEELRVKSEELLEKYLAGKAPLHANRLELPTEEELDEAEAAFDSLTPRPLRGERELKRRRLWPWVGAIAASIVLLIAFNYNNKVMLEEQPVVAEVVEQPAQEVPKVSENSEVSESSDKSEPSEPVKPKRTYKARKAIEEPQLTEAEPMSEEIEIEPGYEYYPSAMPDQSLLAAAFSQDIRARGERLYQENAQMNNQ